MTSSGSKVVVIGGGVIGAMCAWYLRGSGHEVTIVEKDRFGSACSHGNCGYVSPSHVFPLCQPGAIKNALPALLSSKSPLAIRWKWSPALFRWLYKFARRCNAGDMMHSAVGRSALLNWSQDLYKDLIASEKIECEWRENGLLFVFKDKSHFEHYGSTNDLIQNEFGIGAEPYAGDEVVELEPSLLPGLGGGWYFRGDCHLRPDKLMASMKKRLQDLGIQLIESCQVKEFVRHGDTCSGVVVADGTKIDSDHFVVATGALTPFLNRHLGCDVEIQPGKGYSITMPHPSHAPKIPMILEQHRVAITPMKTKYRIGSTMEFAGYDSSINRTRLAMLKTSSEYYLRTPHCAPIEEEWFGWRPMTWDGKPTIDRSPLMKNVWIAAGHNMLGLSMATGTGKLVQQLIDGEQPSVDVGHYSLNRLKAVHSKS